MTPFRIFCGWDSRQAEAAEVWQSVVGFPDYEVSSEGRVRSLPRTVVDARGIARRLTGKVLHPAQVDGKYSTVVLRRDNATSHTVAVHTIVLRAFVGQPLPRQEGAHEDGDVRNNALRNLRWAYPKENHADRLKQGRPMAANLNLTEPQVRDIRARAQVGRAGDWTSGNITALADEYGLDRLCIFRVATRRTYAWVSDA